MIAVAASAAAAVVILPAAPAPAHSVCDQSSPADGSTVQSAPSEVSCLFTEPLLPDSWMIVTDACGRRADDGNVIVAGYRMSVGLASDSPGSYAAQWVTHSAQDGHYSGPGTIAFTVAGGPPDCGRAGATATPSAGPTATPSGSAATSAPDATPGISQPSGSGAPMPPSQSPATQPIAASDGSNGSPAAQPSIPTRTSRPIVAPIAWMLLIVVPLGLFPALVTRRSEPPQDA